MAVSNIKFVRLQVEELEEENRKLRDNMNALRESIAQEQYLIEL